jgi:hypothetical protein
VLEQLNEWLSKTTIRINLLAMCYQPADLAEIYKIEQSERITIHQHNRMSCTFARLECQKMFYSSTYKWGILMDDDACLYPHNSSYNMFKEMDDHIEDYRHISAFWPFNPVVYGFNALYKEDPRYEDHHIFIPLVTPKGTMCILRNLQLYGEEPVYNDTDFDMMEDIAFSIKFRYHGHSLYTTANLILKELSHGASFFGAAPKLGGVNDNSIRIANAKRVSKDIIVKYPGLLEETEKGITINQKALIGKCVVGLKKHIIPKDGVYDTSLFDWDVVR